jgi:hypothetical protein
MRYASRHRYSIVVFGFLTSSSCIQRANEAFTLLVHDAMPGKGHATGRHVHRAAVVSGCMNAPGEQRVSQRQPPIRSIEFLPTGHSFVVACNRLLTQRERTEAPNGEFLRQSQIPQHVEYVLRGAFDVPRTMRNAEPTPQRRTQRTHGNARVG